MDNVDLFPMPLARRDSLILSKSVLSNFLIVWGREERVQRLELGPLEVNELMPEAHLFNQSSADIYVDFQELSVGDMLPSAPVVQVCPGVEHRDHLGEEDLNCPRFSLSGSRVQVFAVLWSQFCSWCFANLEVP